MISKKLFTTLFNLWSLVPATRLLQSFIISKDEHLELYWKTEPNSFFANDCTDVRLKKWLANMDI